LTRQRAKKNNALFGSLSATLRDFKVPFGTLDRVAADLFESLDTPVSLSCEILLRYGEVKQLVSKTVTPSDYSDAFRFRDDYQAVSFLKKAPLVIEGVDPLAAAKEKFFASEVSCAETNRRFRSLCSGSPTGVSGLVKVILLDAAMEVQRALGSTVPSHEWLSACRFGPGAFNHTEAR